jgi:hypothetical protein
VSSLTNEILTFYKVDVFTRAKYTTKDSPGMMAVNMSAVVRMK